MDVAILRVRSTKNRIIMVNSREHTDMITSSNNAKVKQVVQWQTKAKERRKDHVFLAEGVRMCEEAPVKSVREVYLTEELLEESEKDGIPKEYIERNIVPGRKVWVAYGQQERSVFAKQILPDGRLLIENEQHEEEILPCGDVSLRINPKDVKIRGR